MPEVKYLSIPFNSTCTQLLLEPIPSYITNHCFLNGTHGVLPISPMLSTLNIFKLYDHGHVYLVCLMMLQVDSNKKTSGLDLNEDKRPFLVYRFYVSNKILL